MILGSWLYEYLESPHCHVDSIGLQEINLQDDGISFVKAFHTHPRNFQLLNLEINHLTAKASFQLAQKILASHVKIDTISLLYNDGDVESTLLWKQCIKTKKVKNVFLGMDREPLR